MHGYTHPYSYKLGATHGNLSLIQYLYSSHAAGAATAAAYVATWTALQGKLSYEAYGEAEGDATNHASCAHSFCR